MSKRWSPTCLGALCSTWDSATPPSITSFLDVELDDSELLLYGRFETICLDLTKPLRSSTRYIAPYKRFRMGKSLAMGTSRDLWELVSIPWCVRPILQWTDVLWIAQRPRQVGVCMKHLSVNPEARFNSSNVPWQRVINSKGMISPRLVDMRISIHSGRDT
jgi:hypothetical protein